MCAGVPWGQEESQGLVGRLDQLCRAELGDALPDKDFQVLWRGEQGAGHHIYEFLVSLWKARVSAITMKGTDGDVRVDDDGSRVGFTVATSEMCDAECPFPGLKGGKRR